MCAFCAPGDFNERFLRRLITTKEKSQVAIRGASITKKMQSRQGWKAYKAVIVIYPLDVQGRIRGTFRWPVSCLAVNNNGVIDFRKNRLCTIGKTKDGLWKNGRDKFWWTFSPKLADRFLKITCTGSMCERTFWSSGFQRCSEPYNGQKYCYLLNCRRIPSTKF